MMSKVIKFRPLNNEMQQIVEPPTPAHSHIPKWYKELPVQISKDSFRLTSKACAPLLDSISSGYMLTLPMDLSCVDDPEHGKTLNWMARDFLAVENHSIEQIGDYPIPDGYEKFPMKFNNVWGIEAPPGYSLLFMHPLGRFDLPFYSFHGVVDSDLHYVPMNIPFVLKSNFTGIIRRGTPISQVIPIKRDYWKSEIKDHSEFDAITKVKDIMFSVDRWYKDRIWQRKQYR